MKKLILILIIGSLNAESIVVEVNLLFKQKENTISNVVISEAVDGYLFYTNEFGDRKKVDCRQVLSIIDDNGIATNNICKENDKKLSFDRNIKKQGRQIFGGIILSKINSFQDSLLEDNNYFPGLKFGVEKIVNESLRLTFGSSYTQRGYRKDKTSSFMISYLTTYTHYSIPVSDSNLFLLFGTEIGLFLENEIITQICDESDGNCTKIQTIIPWGNWIQAENSMYDYGLLIGARYLINSNFTANISYYYGLRNQKMGTDLTGKNRSIQIYLSYIL